jgi:hypothetical protein
MAEDNLSLLNANLDNSLRPLFANKIFLGSFALFFALYAGWLAPKLPNSVIYFFDTIPGKLLFIFIIAFVASRNVENSFQVALVVSVMFLVTLTVLNKVKMQEAFQNLSMEHFNLMGTMQNLMQGNQEEYMEGGMPGDNSQGANSQGANSQGANSQGANSQGASSQGASSQGANSQGANSQGANSQGANSQGANSNQPGSLGGSCRPTDPKCDGANTCQNGMCAAPQVGSLGGSCRPTDPKCDGVNTCQNGMCAIPQSPNPSENFEGFSNYSQYSDY